MYWLSSLKSWYAHNQHAYKGLSIELEFHYVDGAKAAFIDCVSHSDQLGFWIGRFTLWDSGMCQCEIIDNDAKMIYAQYYEKVSVEDVPKLICQLFSQVVAQKLAEKKHPVTGIPFDKDSFPDFSSVITHEVKINLTGNRNLDFRAANAAADLNSTPKGYTWHHHQDRTTMQLVPEGIHAKTGHTGGFSLGAKK
jgi:hypothetical protein